MLSRFYFKLIIISIACSSTPIISSQYRVIDNTWSAKSQKSKLLKYGALAVGLGASAWAIYKQYKSRAERIRAIYNYESE